MGGGRGQRGGRRSRVQETGWHCAASGLRREALAHRLEAGRAGASQGSLLPPFQHGLPSTASRRFEKGPSSALEANEVMPST